MKCSKCGHVYENHLGFCPLCGFVEAPPQTPPQYAQGGWQYGTQQQQAGYSGDSGSQTNEAPQALHDQTIASDRNHAVASLVCSILGFVIPFVGIVLAVAGIILGSMAKKRLPETERQIATAGYILGIISLVFSIIIVIAILWAIGVALLVGSNALWDFPMQ